MKSQRLKLKLYEKLLLLAAGLYGLNECAPGFRPKHVRDIFVSFLTDRGLGIAVYFGVMLLLLPACYRLRKLGFAQSFIGGLYSILGLFLTVDLLVELPLNAHAASVWVLRTLYLSVVAWGFLGFREFTWDADVRLKQIKPWHWKVFLGLVLFFLVRQEMQLYIARSTPFGDEIYYWYTASREILDEGLRYSMSKHSYTPGIPWLVSFPAKLVGAHREQWLYAFPLFVFCSFVWIIRETALSIEGWVAGIILLFFTLLCNRDMHHLLTVSFYGEGISAVLTAVLMIRVYRTWGSHKSLRRAIGFGLFLGFCSLSKPPLAAIAVLLALIIGVLLERRILSILAVLITTLIPYVLWKTGLTLLGRTPEYTVSIHDFIHKGINLGIPFGMIKGLLVPHAPQQAYTLGMLAALAITLLRRQYKLLFVMLGALAVSWGFVLSLYATLWQDVEPGSAGRYLAHAAMACVLLIPLAFTPKSTR